MLNVRLIGFILVVTEDNPSDMAVYEFWQTAQIKVNNYILQKLLDIGLWILKAGIYLKLKYSKIHTLITGRFLEKVLRFLE